MPTSNETLQCLRSAPAPDPEKRAAEADRADEIAFRRDLVAAYNRKLESQGRPPSPVMLERLRRYMSMPMDGADLHSQQYASEAG